MPHREGKAISDSSLQLRDTEASTPYQLDPRPSQNFVEGSSQLASRQGIALEAHRTSKEAA